MIEYFEFEDSGTFSRFVPAVEDKVYAGQTYTSTVVKRGNIHITEELAKSELHISFSRTHPFARKLLLIIPESVVNLNIYRDTGLYWQGQFTGAKTSKSTIQLIFAPIFTTTRTSGFRARLNFTCRHPIYSTGCGIDKSLFSKTYQAAATDRRISILDLAEPVGYYINGIAEMGGQVRDIANHTATEITLTQPFYGDLTGTIKLSAGCDLAEATCLAKFNNVLNFGGFSRIPSKDPFSSTGLL